METEVMDSETVEAVALPPASYSAVVEKSQVECAVEIAKRYPRSIKKFQQEAVTLATLTEDTAGSMGYTLRRSGKNITGASTRLAEIVATAWGNLRYKAEVVDVGDRMLTAIGHCFDCEKNIAASVTVQRRITGKDGTRYNDDMIVTTGNAACSIALRNAIFKIVPRAYVDMVYREAMKVAFGEAKSLASTREAAFSTIMKLGVSSEQILQVLGKPGIEDVTMDDVVVLRGLFNAIREGEQTIEDAFPVNKPAASDEPTKEPPKPGTKSRVKDKLKAETPAQEPETIPGYGSSDLSGAMYSWSEDRKATYETVFALQLEQNGGDHEKAHETAYKAAVKVA